MDQAEVIVKLKKYKNLLSKFFVFETMVLFGSYAKGCANMELSFKEPGRQIHFYPFCPRPCVFVWVLG